MAGRLRRAGPPARRQTDLHASKQQPWWRCKLAQPPVPRPLPTAAGSPPSPASQHCCTPPLLLLWRQLHQGFPCHPHPHLYHRRLCHHRHHYCHQPRQCRYAAAPRDSSKSAGCLHALEVSVPRPCPFHVLRFLSIMPLKNVLETPAAVA